MHTINRSLVVIKPKQPFVDWENNLPDRKPEISLEQMRDDCTVYLLPEVENDSEARKQIEKIWRDVFDYELYGWCTNEEWLPVRRTKRMFWDWFDVEFHSEIIDVSQKLLVKEEW